jgi:hypothetical protein
VLEEDRHRLALLMKRLHWFGSGALPKFQTGESSASTVAVSPIIKQPSASCISDP